LQDDLLRLEAYKADLSHLNLSLSNLIAQLVGANSSSAPLLITQNNSSGRAVGGKFLSCVLYEYIQATVLELYIWKIEMEVTEIILRKPRDFASCQSQSGFFLGYRFLNP
jgi:hypothetical protein